MEIGVKIQTPHSGHRIQFTNACIYETKIVTYHVNIKANSSQPMLQCEVPFRPVSLPKRRFNAENAKLDIHYASWSATSWMKLFSAISASFRHSWFTSSPSLDISSYPILTRPSPLARFRGHRLATSHRFLVFVKGGHESMISLLSRRTVKALRTLRKML